MLVIRVRWYPSRPVTLFTLLRLLGVGPATGGFTILAFWPVRNFSPERKMLTFFEVLRRAATVFAFRMSMSFAAPTHKGLLCYSSGSFADFTSLKRTGFENRSAIVTNSEGSPCHGLSRFLSERDDCLSLESFQEGVEVAIGALTYLTGGGFVLDVVPIVVAGRGGLRLSTARPYNGPTSYKVRNGDCGTTPGCVIMEE